MTTRQYILIDGGPNKDRLIDAFKYAFDRDLHFRVTFSGTRFYTVVPGLPDRQSKEEFTAKIISLKHDDGSGACFIVEAHVVVFGSKKTVTFFYDANTRTGRLNLP